MHISRLPSFLFLLPAAWMLAVGLPARAVSSYLALGDSITTGYQPGGTHLADDAFAGLVASRLGLALDNRAVDGNTAAGIAAQLQGGTLDSAVAAASLITMTVGGNDTVAAFYAEVASKYNASYSPVLAASDVPGILSDSSDSRYLAVMLSAYSVLTSGTFTQSASFTNALASFTLNFTNIVAYLRRVNPSAPLVVETQYNPYQWLGSDSTSLAISNTFDAGVQELNAVISAPSNGAGSAYRVADVYTAFAASSANLCCATGTSNLDFHPNVAGHAVIAETMLEALDLVPSLTVNGAAVSVVGGGAGTVAWTYADATNLTLAGAGPYVIGGSNGTHVVSIRAAADCAVVASNLAVNVSASDSVTAFDCGTNAVTLALWSDAGTTNTFMSGEMRAGIRTTDGSLTVTNLNESAALFARGGIYGAGIGGGSDGAGGTVEICGGTVTTVGNACGAGIGGGLCGAGGVVTISGGTVTTTGGDGDGGAGIGGGLCGAGGTVTISGGTVFAKGGSEAQDIGHGKPSPSPTIPPTAAATSSGPNTFTGGSVFLASGSILLAPSNGTARVWCVTNGGFVANARAVVSGLPTTYGTTDLYADAGGKIYLWLPAGDYAAVSTSATGGATNAVLRGWSVSATGAVTGPTNAVLTITGYDAATGAMTHSPEALPDTVLTTIYSTNLVDWAETIPARTNTLFMKLRVK